MKASPVKKPVFLIVIAALMALLVGAGVFAYRQKPLLELGVGYGARVACGCRYIGKRSLADCHKDFEPGMELIQLSEDVKAKSVRASVPLIASRTARYDPVLGCEPEPFKP